VPGTTAMPSSQFLSGAQGWPADTSFSNLVTPAVPPNSSSSNFSAKEASDDKPWKCPACTFLNSPQSSTCEICDTIRGAVGLPKQSNGESWCSQEILEVFQRLEQDQKDMQYAKQLEGDGEGGSSTTVSDGLSAWSPESSPGTLPSEAPSEGSALDDELRLNGPAEADEECTSSTEELPSTAVFRDRVVERLLDDFVVDFLECSVEASITEDAGLQGGLNGFVFVCNNATYKSCVNRGLFGLPKSFLPLMQGITANTLIFLFNFESQLLYGVWSPRGNPALCIDPLFLSGASSRSRFPAQLRVGRREEHPPLDIKKLEKQLLERFGNVPHGGGLTDPQMVSFLLENFAVQTSSRGPVDRLKSKACQLLTREAATTIMHRWLLCTSTLEGSSVVAGKDAQALLPAEQPLDPVIPSHDSDRLCKFVRAQLGCLCETGQLQAPEEALDEVAEDLASKFLSSAKEVSEQCRREHTAGHDWTDKSVAVELTYQSIPGEDNRNVAIVWRRKCSVHLSESTFNGLEQVYTALGHPRSRMLSRIFNTIMRYETLARVRPSHEMSLLPAVSAVLQKELAITHECFASPLNCFQGCSTHCSLFPDVDHFFGSVGSFFGFLPQLGSCVLHPPAQKSSIEAALAHVVKVLVAAPESSALSFVAVVSEIDGFDPVQDVEGLASYVQAVETLSKGNHAFAIEMPHRCASFTGSPEKMNTSVNTTHNTRLIFIQNTEGCNQYPVNKEIIQAVTSGFEP